MFDIGWSELLLIGIVALIVVGPKDLPAMFRALGRFTAKMRTMAREFSRAMESAADEAGIKDVAKDLKDIKRSAGGSRDFGLDSIRKTVKEATADLEALRDPLKAATSPGRVAGQPSPAPASAPAASTAAAPAQPAAERGPATAALAAETKARAEALQAEYATRRAAAPPTAAPAAPSAQPPAAAPKGDEA